MPSNATRIVAIVAVASACASLNALAQDSRASNISLFANATGTDTVWVGDTELMKAIRDRLGGRYAHLNMVFGVCESEGFAREGKRLLGGNFSVAASRDYNSSEEIRTNALATVNNKTGLAITSVQYAHGWTPSYFRGLDDNANRTSTQLFDFASANDHALGRATPRFEFGGTGNEKNLKPLEAGGRIAIIKTEAMTRLDSRFLPDTGDQILRRKGYTNDTIDWAYAQRGGQNEHGVPIDHSATKSALLGENGIIESTRTFLGDSATKSSNFIFVAHGASERRRAERKPDAIPNLPNQGKQVTPGGTGGPMSLLPSDINGFFEEFLVDDPDLDRMTGSRPTIFLTTIEEDFAGAVDVYLDTVNVGQIQLQGSATGASYQLQFSDQAWSSVFTAGVLDDLFVEISFQFAGGSFRIATEWDQALYDLDRFGVGLSKPAIYGIPTPGALALAAFAMLPSSRRARRSRHAAR